MCWSFSNYETALKDKPELMQKSLSILLSLQVFVRSSNANKSPHKGTLSDKLFQFPNQLNARKLVLGNFEFLFFIYNASAK